MGMLLTWVVVLAGINGKIAGAAGKMRVTLLVSVASYEVSREDLT